MSTTTTPPPVEPTYRDIGGTLPITGLVAVAITTRRPQLIDAQINEIKAGKLLSAEHQITLLKLIQGWIAPTELSKRAKDADALAEEISKAAEALAESVSKATDTLTSLAARVGQLTD